MRKWRRMEGCAEYNPLPCCYCYAGRTIAASAQRTAATKEAGKVSKAAGRRERREGRDGASKAPRPSLCESARRPDGRRAGDGRSEHGDRAVKTSNRGRGRAPPFADLPSLPHEQARQNDSRFETYSNLVVLGGWFCFAM